MISRIQFIGLLVCLIHAVPTEGVITDGFYQVVTGEIVNAVSYTVRVTSLKTCTLACHELMTSDQPCKAATFNTETLECHLSSGETYDTSTGFGEHLKTVRLVQCKLNIVFKVLQ